MKIGRLISLVSLLAFLSVLMFSTRLNQRHKASADAGTHYDHARLSEKVSLHTARRGNPWINFEEGRDLLTAYDNERFVELASQGVARPLSLASADFDEDGVPDLIGGYGGNSSMITIHRGNVDSIYPNSPEAKQRQGNGDLSDSPFLSPALVFAVPEAPDFIAAGDFDGDSHWDVAAAKRGGNVLYLLSGDGRGKFRSAESFALAGQVTSMVCGDINRRDGLNDLVIAIASPQGQKALVFESPEGALRGEPETIALPAEAHALAIGQLDETYEYDLAIAAGSELMIVQGRDRKLSLDETRRAEVVAPRVDRIDLPFDISAMAIGDFAGDLHVEIALMSEDGKARLASRKNKSWAIDRLADGRFESTSQMISARVSSLPHDNLVLVDEKNLQLHVLMEAEPRETGDVESAASTLRRLQAVTLDVEDAPVAVLPMRLNGDALSDLVLLKAGSGAIAVATTAPMTIFPVTNTGDSGAGSLRQAISNANNNPGMDTISFNIGTGIQTITPLSLLPTATESVLIEGTSQGGFSGTPLIEINGVNLPNNFAILSVGGSATTVRGLVINRGIPIGISGSGHIVEGNFLGTNTSGTATTGGSFFGVAINFGSPNNLIGGTTAAARNIISGTSIGVNILNSDSTNNLVRGNFIGTNVTGTVALPNGTGVAIGSSSGAGFAAFNNIVGGTAAGAANIISGNSASGVLIINGSIDNQVQANLIGTDVTGTADLGNVHYGVRVQDAPRNLVGGTSAATRNVISGNNLSGVGVLNSGSNVNQIQGNFIGTDISGAVDLGNTQSGVQISDAISTAVGGDTAVARNIISGNNLHGVNIAGGGGTNGVLGNFIGTNVSGDAPLGNMMDGVRIEGTTSFNAIGGPTSTAGNLIAFNGQDGVIVTFGVGGTFGAANFIAGNSIFSNSGLGINLGSDGITPNDDGDADTGPNNLQNFPVLTSASTTAVQGTLNSTANTNVRIDFFSNPSCDSSGNGEGKTSLGAINLTTNGSGDANFTFTFSSPIAPGQFITATATGPNTNTSEFSQCVAVSGGVGSQTSTIGVYLSSNRTFYLRNTNDPGFADLTILYGPSGVIPLVGDWDGNGTTTIGVYDPGSRIFYLRNSNTPGFADLTILYGPPGAIPLAGDWDGNGTTTIGVYDPSSRIFYLRNSNTPGFADLTILYGPAGVTPVVGDWDGNATTTIGVYDPVSRTFYLRNSNTIGFADLTILYGPAGVTPVVGDWDGNGTTTIGVYDPTTRTFYLRNSNTVGFADLALQYGPPAATPLGGDWDGL